MKMIHLIGPPTDPCRTPLPWTNGSATLPLPSMIEVVAPPCCEAHSSPSSQGDLDPASRLTINSTSSLGMPNDLRLSACDQYSSVSNALLRSVAKRCSSCPVTLASSISSAMTLRGACTPAFDIAPYCLRSSILCFSMEATTLPTITLSYTLSKCSIRLMGLVRPRSDMPCSVFGSIRSRALFTESGTRRCLLHLSKNLIISSRQTSSRYAIMSSDTSEGPGALPFPAFFICAFTSARDIGVSYTPSHHLCSIDAAMFACHSVR